MILLALTILGLLIVLSARVVLAVLEVGNGTVIDPSLLL